VIEGTPAEKAGLLAEDLITEIDGEDLAGEDPTARLKEIVGGRPPGTKLTVITLMNAQAVPQIRPNGGQPRVDAEKADQLLRNDYLRWLTEQRSIHQAQ
jgi:membrane-associated protease RseP (regulator of RpoE activity)